uniref:Uncharacterized protein n=1 Tax=Anguilla anguilla TaxID=7936 RepID=A0A0E9VLB2_ANGAN
MYIYMAVITNSSRMRS